ncbi:hypothetical protein [Rhizobacter sp. J219]
MHKVEGPAEQGFRTTGPPPPWGAPRPSARAASPV